MAMNPQLFKANVNAITKPRIPPPRWSNLATGASACVRLSHEGAAWCRSDRGRIKLYTPYFVISFCTSCYVFVGVPDGSPISRPKHVVINRTNM